jgi:hypothetical protein
MTAKEFIEKFKPTDINAGELLDMGCRKCGHRANFSIHGHAMFDVTSEDGAVDHDDPKWDYTSACKWEYAPTISPMR